MKINNETEIYLWKAKIYSGKITGQLLIWSVKIKCMLLQRNAAEGTTDLALL